MTSLVDERATAGAAGGRRSARHGAPAPPRRARLPLPGLVLAAVAAGAAGVVALWWRDTASIGGTGDWLTNAGRITGLLAGYAAPVLLLLMARVPVLDRGIGADRLARWHATGGRYLVGLVTAHVLLIVWGYALTGHTGPVQETADLVLHFPDMLKATAGTLLLLATGAVSARAARRRLRYETWYYLHLATYAAVALAFGHQLSNGAEFVGDRPAQLAWYALYLGAAALLAWFRLLLPLRRAARHRLRVAEVRPEGPGVVSVYITGRYLPELAAQPGQFFRWRFLAPGLRWTANPYSLSAPPHPRYLRITVKGLGDHSRALARLRPGTRVYAEGPYGAFTAARRRSRKVLLVAAGVGITPVRALFETLPAAPGDLTLVYRASHSEDLVLRRELEEIAAARGARLYYLVGPRSVVGEPLSALTLSRLVPDLRRHDVYLCGPEGMARTARVALRAAGVRRRRIHHESFAL